MDMLRHSTLVMSLSTMVTVQLVVGSAVGSGDEHRRRPEMHAPHASSDNLWNPIDAKTAMPEHGFADSETYRNWAESIDDDRYLDFLSRDGVLPASRSMEPDPALGFGLPKASMLDGEAGDDILEIVEAGRAGMSEAEDPVRRWCAVGELPSRTDVDHGLRRNRFFIGQGRGMADEIDYDRLHEMVFEAPAVIADRYDATGDGVLDDVVFVDVGGMIIEVVNVGGDGTGTGFGPGGRDRDRCVIARSAVIESWIRRRRQEGY